MSNSHSRLAPSAAHRWAECTASVQFIESLKLPPEPSSEYADEGTEAHVVFAEALGLENPFDVVYQTSEQKEYLPHAIEYVEAIRAQHPTAPIYREVKVDPAPFVRTVHCAGTADVVIPVDLGTLYVLDLKFGVHVAVDVIDNYQLLLYALGALAKFEAEGYVFTDIVLAILQPRAYHPAGSMRQWRISYDELTAWAKFFATRAREALGNDPIFRPNPDETCRFCPAQGVCRHLAEYELKQARRAFKSIVDEEAEYLDVNELTPKEFSHLLNIFPGMRRWMSSVSEYALRLLEADGKIPYWGLESRFGNRAWAIPPEELELYFDEEVLYERKLRSPAQVEKLAGKKSVDNFVTREQTGHTIVKTDDPSEADETMPFDKVE